MQQKVRGVEESRSAGPRLAQPAAPTFSLRPAQGERKCRMKTWREHQGSGAQQRARSLSPRYHALLCGKTGSRVPRVLDV
eukprot:s4095_g15.t1